jgi:hypothetical protein
MKARMKLPVFISLILVLVLGITSIVLADIVQNNVIGDGNVTITAPGSTTITYNLVGNNAPRGDISGCNVDLDHPATLTINVPEGVNIDKTSVQFTECGEAGVQSVTFSSSTPDIYSITHSITGGNTGSLYANQADFSLTVLGATALDQTITFNSLDEKTYGDDPFQVSAIASSELPVSFSVEGNCTLGADNYVTITGAGTCTVTASQAGDDSYNAADPVSQSFNIAKADANCMVTGYTGIFDNAEHGASGSCKGINDEVAGTLDLGATYKYPPGGNANWSFAGNVNYNDQSGTVEINIIAWTPTGFYKPVDMGEDVLNTVKGGSTVPLKFNVYAGTTEKTDLASVKSVTSQLTTCKWDAVQDPIDAVMTGGTSLRYDTLAGQFVYNWQTPKQPGKCYVVTATMLDNSIIKAFFMLK